MLDSHNKSWLTSCEIHGGQSGIEAGTSMSSFEFPLLLITPSLLHTHLSPPPEVCNSLNQRVHHHTLSLQFGGFISDMGNHKVRNFKFLSLFSFKPTITWK